MLPYFAFTLFVSATLLFLVQPLVGKMILPLLGGTPAVWNTCMVFFQAVLLVGYTYTHTLSTWQNRRRQLIVQFVVLLLPLLFMVLPFRLGNWTPPEESNPVFSVLFLLLGMVGLPFFVVSTSAPLLQRWFGLTGHPAAKDPYFLYGASNLGSMLGLLAYPIFFEPAFDVGTQALVWTVGYCVFALLVGGCIAIVWKQAGMAPALEPAPPPPPPAPPETNPAKLEQAITAKRLVRRRAPVTAAIAAAPEPLAPLPPLSEKMTWWRRFRWIGLAAAPSSLMLGLTTEMTTDIAAVPFFWVVPLALYLLTFILVFARWPAVWTDVPHTVVLYAQPCFLLFLVLIRVAGLSLNAFVEMGFHVMAFLTTTLLCHGELAKDRPSAAHLTEFYLLMSLGGVLGGMFNALMAPIFFKYGVVEYWLAMVLACVCRPSMVTEFTLVPGDTDQERTTPLGWVLEGLLPFLLGGLTWLFLFVILDRAASRGWDFPKRNYLMAVPVILLLTMAMRPRRFSLGLSILLLVTWWHDKATEQVVYQDRGFFGFVRVREDRFTRKEDGKKVEYRYNVLIHGQIDHGRQYIDFDPNRTPLRRLPISYFHPTNGIGQIFQQYSWPDARLPASMVGLGALTGPVPAGILCDLHSEPPFAVVGLGAGTLASHARPWQTMHIYEIDPLVRNLSLPPDGNKPFFTYVKDAIDRKADAHIIMGDGRLTMQRDMKDERYLDRTPTKKDKLYHIIVLDAFSSDAIPVHLLTSDAIGEYLEKLADGGVLIFNTTNRYVDIRGVLGKIAEEHDLECMMYGDYNRYYNKTTGDMEDIPDKFGSDWVVMRRNQTPVKYTGAAPLHERLSPSTIYHQVRPYYESIKRHDLVEKETFDKHFTWRTAPVDDGPVWTDGYSNLLSVVYWGLETSTLWIIALFAIVITIGPFVGGAGLLICGRIVGHRFEDGKPDGGAPTSAFAKAMGLAFVIYVSCLLANAVVYLAIHDGILRTAIGSFIVCSFGATVLVCLGGLQLGRALAITFLFWLLTALITGVAVGGYALLNTILGA